MSILMGVVSSRMIPPPFGVHEGSLNEDDVNQMLAFTRTSSQPSYTSTGDLGEPVRDRTLPLCRKYCVHHSRTAPENCKSLLWGTEDILVACGI